MATRVSDLPPLDWDDEEVTAVDRVARLSMVLMCDADLEEREAILKEDA